ncbi:MAG: DNA alkylation repair protein [Tenericutes bacterium]|nr:DNA alkylation repair protein [Mycoplasmatota bacterium]
MILNRSNWNKSDYQKFVDYLFSFEDLEYKNFNSKLVLKNNLIGIRVPILKKIAKELAKGNYKEFISIMNHNYHEEVLIHGLILGYIKDPMNYFDDYIKYMNDWQSCDTTISNMKYFKYNQDINYIKKYLYHRVGYVILLTYYIKDEYIDELYNIVDNYNSDSYYVKMAVAWLLSYLIIYDKNRAVKYLKKSKLDDFTYNKGIQKAIESKKIKDKKWLKDLKR